MQLTHCAPPVSLGMTLLADLVAADGVPVVTVPSTCTSGFQPGTDTVLLTVPYTPAQVVGIVGDFQNLTWSGNDPSTVTLNGTDNEVGTARSYTSSGLAVIETLYDYYRPALDGCGNPIKPNLNYPPGTVFSEAHTFAQVDFQGDSVYMPFDGLVVTSMCGGLATRMNYSSGFCATNVSQATTLLHALHTQDLANVQAMLGNDTFTSCDQFPACS